MIDCPTDTEKSFPDFPFTKESWCFFARMETDACCLSDSCRFCRLEYFSEF